MARSLAFASDVYANAAEMMFHQATLYQLASIITYNFGGNSVRTPPLVGVKPIEPGTCGKLISVYVVNSAFGLELYLKCLLVTENKKPKRHHVLKDHFDALEPANQTEIRAGYEVLRSRVTVHMMGSGVGADGRLIPLDECISASSEAFEQWRYLYENPTSAPRIERQYSAAPVALVIREMLVKRHPTWQRHLAHFER